VPIHHIVTVSPGLPVAVFDSLLTAIERALEETGASRVWIDPALPPMSVVAELPTSPPDDAHPADVGPLVPRTTDGRP
jgi:hypothetical protein